ncbi:tetratricopeptide repeat protein [Methylomonas sp. LL1]|uniref:tetratricopeptide repeat protein n=1 Tax=Methylomonas sp. LL1 TaxID=2785785 RepID=UPI0018C35410|nr:tetratricopeptide repeat protein [Methylomonas sp. LL1]QPK63291.1 tetratricopeptide repeat protein [Methylomonas sp. LL1]
MLIGKFRKYKSFLPYLVVNALVLTACNSPEEMADNHLQKGKEFFEKGEYDKAILELKTSSQSGDQRSDTYYYMALLDEKNNNFKSMRENLFKTVELDPNNLEARQKLGKVHLLFGDLDKALEQANFVLSARPEDADSKLLKASVYIRQGKKDQATEIVDTVIAANLENIDALSLKAAIFFEDNQLDKALDLVNSALIKDTKNLPLRLFKIKINAKRNNIEAIIDDYKELVRIYPDAENFKLSLASIYSMTDKLELAEALLREMLDKNQDKVEPKIVLLEFLNAKVKDRVEGEFKSMLAKSGKNSTAILELSKWMLASGYIDAASGGLMQVAEMEGNSNTGLTAKTILAEIALNKKEYEKVEKSIAEVLAVNSDFVEASLLKARLLLAQNNPDQAIELLNKTVWTKNDSDNAFMLLGQAYVLKKDQKQADKNFKQALEINPANIQAFSPIYGGYLQANQKETARQYLDKALKSKPNQALFLTNKAELDILEKKWDDAQETVQRLALFSKNKAVPFYLQANILQGKGQYADAIKLYEKLLVEFPEHLNSMANLVRSYEALKQRDKALSFLEAHQAKHKDNLVVVGVLSDIYMANKDYEKAKQLLLNQIKMSPDKSVPLYLALAKVEAVLGKGIDNAREVYVKGLQVNPDDPQLSMALAGLYEQTGNKSEARKIYERLIAMNPDTNLAINNLAALLIESNSSEDVLKGLEMAERFKDMDNTYFQDTYAWGLVKNGKSKEGLAVLESLVVKEPKMPELRYHLGVAHFKSGNKATAIVELKQAIALSEKQQKAFAGRDEAKKMLSELEH